MVNLFITYRCNLACPYCFAREHAALHPGDMAFEAFADLAPWLARAAMPAVGFLGGEPTLHPRLADMAALAARSGVAVVVFTNGLFAPELAQALVPHVANFVVNANDPSFYTSVQHAKLHANLTRLKTLGANLTFSKNFSADDEDFEYLLEMLDLYAVRAVRYDISRPGLQAGNVHFRPDQTSRAMATAVRFAKACHARGVATGIDCCVKPCDLDPDDLAFLERVSMKFRGVCHPSVDIHPDLSASYCLPLGDVRVDSVTDYSGPDALMAHFARIVRPLRIANPAPSCQNCSDLGRRCQGGCLASRRRDPGEKTCFEPAASAHTPSL